MNTPQTAGYYYFYENVYDHTINRVKNGDYRAAQMVGTKETAEAYKTAAEKAGVKKAMKSNGISSKTTEKLADVSLGKHVGKTTAANACKAGAIGAAVGAGVELAEAIINKEDPYDATGDIITGAAEGALTGAAGAAVGSIAVAGLTAAGATGTVAVAAPAVATIAAGVGLGFVADKAVTHFEIDKKISKGTRVAVTGIKDFAHKSELLAEEWANEIRNRRVLSKIVK